MNTPKGARPLPKALVAPISGWVGLSVILLGWQYHRHYGPRAEIHFTVQSERKHSPEERRITLNGLPFQSGERSGVGQKVLRIELADTEPFETNLFVWYRGASLGTITLPKSRGTLSLQAGPTNNFIDVVGDNFERHFTNCVTEDLNLPVGTYYIHSSFARFATQSHVRVSRNKTEVVRLDPGIGAVELKSEPPDATFELRSVAKRDVTVSGQMPVLLQDLPAGLYRLTYQRDDYRKETSFSVRHNETNVVSLNFKYAQVSIQSDPPGANVKNGTNQIGVSPGSFSLPPGDYALEVGRDGFYSTNISVTLAEGDSRSFPVTLINVAYTESLRRAREILNQSSPDYDEALAQIARALEAVTNDATAIELQKSVELNRGLQRAAQLQRSGDLVQAAEEVRALLKLYPTNRYVLTLQETLERAKRRAPEREAVVRKPPAQTTAPPPVDYSVVPARLFDQLFAKVEQQEGRRPLTTGLRQSRTTFWKSTLPRELARQAVLRAGEQCARKREPESDRTTGDEVTVLHLCPKPMIPGIGNRNLFGEKIPSRDRLIVQIHNLPDNTVDIRARLIVSDITRMTAEQLQQTVDVSFNDFVARLESELKQP